MPTRIGTAHFVSRAHAIRYYRAYCTSYREAAAEVDELLAGGSIHLGPPPKKHDTDQIVLIDGGDRYALEVEKF